MKKPNCPFRRCNSSRAGRSNRASVESGYILLIVMLIVSLFFFHGIFLQGTHIRPELRDLQLPG